MPSPMRKKQLVLLCSVFSYKLHVRISSVIHYHCEGCITEWLCFLLQLSSCHISTIVDSLQIQSTKISSKLTCKLCTLLAESQ